MKVLVIGAHGQIGQQLVSMLAKGGYQARAMIRDDSQRAELEKRGGEVVVADLEKDFDHALDGVEAVIFSAGSGGHTGPEKTDLVDRQGAIKAMDQSKQHHIERFLLVSTMNADTPDEGPNFMKHYFQAKGAADDHLRESGLTYTIVRPGHLSNDAGNGEVEAAEKITDRTFERRIPRADVAQTLLTSLVTENTFNRTFELLSGHTSIAQALRML